MNNTPLITRDERTIAVEQAGYLWAYCFITFALLIDVMIRSFFFNEAAWDLLALVIVGGGISTAYQYIQNALTKPLMNRAWLIVIIGSGVAAMIVAMIVSLK